MLQSFIYQHVVKRNDHQLLAMTCDTIKNTHKKVLSPIYEVGEPMSNLNQRRAIVKLITSSIIHTLEL